MVKRPLGPTALALLVALAFWPGRMKAADATCADCHEQAKTFSANPHGRAKCDVPGDAACVSCHGDGKKHMEEGGDKQYIRGLHGRAGANVCLTCHDVTTEHESFRDGAHGATETVNCLSCHSIHSPAPKAAHLLAKTDPTLCASCHQGQAASLRDKPYKHHLDRGGLGCVSCHDPHGRKGEGMLKLGRGGDGPCVTCHTEKRGPFVFEHVGPTVGGCLSCHTPHGSPNPKQLIRSNVNQLCLECHSQLGGSFLGSRPPATHNQNLARWRNCTTCHTAVHGSNQSQQLLK